MTMGKGRAETAHPRAADDLRPERPLTGDQVVAMLREMVSAGRFARGEPIHERDLAVAVGAGRGLVRDAMSLLAAEGLLSFDRYRGHAVVDPDIKEVRELLTMRSALEGFAAARAAANADPGLVAELRARVAEMRRASARGNRLSFFEIDLAFHETIVRMADHQLLLDNWIAVTDRLALSARIVVSDTYDGPGALADLADRHDVLIGPLVAGDVGEARRLSEEHPLDALERYELARPDRRPANG
ncbi:GntR family transcriptional regulator [Umezawaea tangerina]|uniref:GntR family transcriptional regulator n=1 Tax=Umezawaea tangerina TaxID=84725 RepID=A0A2T0T7L6_9PSEU|nr:GntR family transcriptional regulator [Umezawaea tangerina]PRY41631.1 GntR family transcriptional regulator [Umezawaea tangerina]